MFCRKCGKEIPNDARFCTSCGADQQNGMQANTTTVKSNTVNETISSVSEKLESTNSFCIASLVVTFIAFFIFDYYNIGGFAALVLGFMGWNAIKKNGQKGATLAIISIAVAGIKTLVFFVQFAQISQSQAQAYGAMNGLLQWLEDYL